MSVFAFPLWRDLDLNCLQGSLAASVSAIYLHGGSWSGHIGLTLTTALVSHELSVGHIAHPSALILQVDNWNPLTDTVPIHSWIHPWLPLMQARLEPLYSPVRSKLSSALQKWHPSDASAKLILQPWKEVLTPGSWEAFMLRNIVPKLGKEPGSWRLVVAYLLSVPLHRYCLGER